MSQTEETTQEAIKDLKEKGTDIIIALSHLDLMKTKNWPGMSQTFLIVGGHSHTPLSEAELLGQAGSNLQYLGVLKLAYHPENDILRIRNQKNHTPLFIPIDSSIPPDPTIEEMVRESASKLNQWLEEITSRRFSNLYEEIVYLSSPLLHTSENRETPLGNFLTDAMRLVTEEI